MVTKAMTENEYYTYRVTWAKEDEEYVGLCAEFPSLSWLADTPEAAFNGIRDLVAEVLSDMKSNNEPIPEPIAIRHYSGIFTVRVTPDLHRRIAIKAAEAKVSINRFVSAKLAE
jgi:predicted HicB family RNase H-like nuclease